MTDHSYHVSDNSGYSEQQFSFNSAEDESYCYLGNNSSLGTLNVDQMGPLMGMSIINSTKKNGRMLIYKAQLYYACGGRNDISYWRCSQNNCKSKAHTRGASIIRCDDHDHEPNYFDLSSRLFNHRLKLAVKTDLSVPPGQVYYSVANDFKVELQSMNFESVFIAQVIRDESYFKSSIDRWRRETRPKLPRYLSEIDLSSPSYSQIVERVTGTTKQFLLYDGHDDIVNPLIIYATADFLKIMALNNGGPGKIFADGTFKSAPHLFKQIYTIHAYWKDHLIPCVFVLCCNKSQGTYEKILEIISEKVLAITGHEGIPEAFQTDFEIAMINALKSKWPLLMIKGCFFHYVKAIFGKAYELGLKSHVSMINYPVRYLVKGCASLAFIPAETVHSEFTKLTNVLQQDAEYIIAASRFISYMRAYWIGHRNDSLQIDVQPRYQISQWNQFQVFSDRTNNKVEGWHNKLNKIMERKNNIYDFTEALIKLQRSNETKLLSVQGNYRPPAKPVKKYAMMNSQLKQFWVEYENNMLTTSELLQKVAFALPSFS